MRPVYTEECEHVARSTAISRVTIRKFRRSNSGHTRSIIKLYHADGVSQCELTLAHQLRLSL